MKSVIDTDSRILVAGSGGPVGRAIVDVLADSGASGVRVINGDDNSVLEDADRTDKFFADSRPELVFMAGGKSGGIGMNMEFPAELVTNNLRIQCNVMLSAVKYGVRKLLYLASSCCYPRECPQPMSVDRLMTGPLEPTSEPYATAKIAGIRLCQSCRREYGVDFIVGIPSNPYGPGDKFDPDNSHVIEALIEKMHRAKIKKLPFVEVWGTGKPRRDFIYTRDLALACVFVMKEYSDGLPINLGTGGDVSIAELSDIVREVVEFRGKLVFDPSKPDGMPRKQLDASALIKLGWRPGTDLKSGIAATYAAYQSESASRRQG